MTTGGLERTPELHHAPTQARPKRILLVEDDLHVAETLAELLRLEGYHVMVAHDAESGLTCLRKETVDLVLCDLSLPGDVDGYGFAQACRDEPALRALHLVAVSGYDRPVDRRRAQASGFDDLIGKPIDLERIHSAIDAGRPSALHPSR